MENNIDPKGWDDRQENTNGQQKMQASLENDFLDLIQLAGSLCDIPNGYVTLVAPKNLWTKVGTGIEISLLPKDSFVTKYLLGSTPATVEVNLSAEEFQAVESDFLKKLPGVQYLFSVPIIQDGVAIGLFWLFDTVARQLTDIQKSSVEVLARQAGRLLQLQLKTNELDSRQVENQRLTRQLQKLHHSQNQTISYIAHDVRNPLASLKNIIELNDLRILSASELNNLMIMLNKQLVGTLDMLTNLIEWAQAQIKRQIPHTRPVDLHYVVDTKYKNLEVTAQLKNNVLVNNVAEGLYVLADEYLLRFILRNLAGNANKFTTGGRITISARQEHHRVLITVADTGIGISDEILKQLFNPDHRITHPGTDNEKGTGIGLILVKEFIEKLGSTLNIMTQPGTGTEFSFWLPIAQAPVE